MTNRPVVMCDRDHVSPWQASPRRNTWSAASRRNWRSICRTGCPIRTATPSGIRPVEGIDRTACILYPIIASSDVNGAVVLLSSETQEPAGETDEKLVQAAAFFLAKQMEE